MTVCLGALCDGNDIKNTANFIMCADTLVTYVGGGVPISSNPNGSKIFPLPFGFYCAMADDLTQSHVFISKLWDGMKLLSPTDTAFYDKVKLVVDQTGEYIRRWRLLDILGKFGFTLDEYLHDPKLVKRDEIKEELESPVIPIELIVAGFQKEKPIVFHHDGTTIHEQTTLGFYVAGSGRESALYWLNFRKQTLSMTSQRTFFHVLEAKKFAEQNPTVGMRTFCLFMSPGITSSLDLDTTAPQIIKTWANDFHVKSTDALDGDPQHDLLFSHFTPLTSRT